MNRAPAEVLEKNFDWPDLDDPDEAKGSPDELLEALVQRPCG
jgi:hypothetical protein